MERWALDKFELDQIIDNGFLSVCFDHNYDPRYHPEFLNPILVKSLVFADYNPDKLFFKLIDIIRFEETHSDIIEQMGKNLKGLSKTKNISDAFPPKEKKDELPKEVIDLINKARLEIESIYKAIKEGEGFNKQGESHDEARMKDALYYFEENENKFEIIRKEDLRRKDIFQIYSSQYSRKVKGGLLQTIIKRHGHGRHAANKLFKAYQKIKQ